MARKPQTIFVQIAAYRDPELVKTIEDMFGKEYSLSEPRKFKTKAKGAQEAHEAIRPTDPIKTPESLKKDLDTKSIPNIYFIF